jgi:uncharacterized membrane protein YgdD (TMEM256/DUF423 family)
MRTNFLFLSALSAFSGVALGAFGAHGLKAVLTSTCWKFIKPA